MRAWSRSRAGILCSHVIQWSRDVVVTCLRGLPRLDERLGGVAVGVGARAPLARREHAPLAHGAHAPVLRQPRVDALRVVR